MFDRVMNMLLPCMIFTMRNFERKILIGLITFVFKLTFNIFNFHSDKGN